MSMRANVIHKGIIYLVRIWGAARNIEAMVTILTENIDTKEVDRLI